MALFPAERFVIDVPAAPDEVRERLARAVAHRARFSRRRPDLPFTGTVGTSSFDLRPVLGYGNSFAPTARGSISSSTAGARIDVRLRMLPAVSVFMGFWLTAAAGFFIGMLIAAFHQPHDRGFRSSGLPSSRSAISS